LPRNLFKYIVSIAFLVLAEALCAQNDGHSIFSEPVLKGIPVFRYNIFRTLTENKNVFVINIHADIANDRLQFLKKDSLYHASYSISAAVFSGEDIDRIPLYQRSESADITTAQYRETQSPLSVNHHDFRIETGSGRYTVVIILKDINTGKQHRIRKTQEYGKSGSTEISDIMMVYWKDDGDFEKNYEVLINNIVDKQSEYTGALFEILTDGRISEKFDIRYRIRNSEGVSVFDDSFSGSTRDKLQLQVLKIPLEKLNAGNYRIDMDINISGKKISRSSVFYLRWKDISLNVSDIDSAVEQMLYIAEFDSIDHVFKLPEEEKRAWFKNYWNELETSLGLKTNSLMEEYFRRIAYSNMHFSVPQKAGWKTDMGKVLCLLGDPDEIQSYPFAKNQRPYEVWVYYEIGAQYIFDYVGGEYRLRK
jgi:GWxTD domain-containing protein